MTVRTMVASRLGAFQDIWDAWNESDDEIKAKPLRHFEVAVREQFREFDLHRRNGQKTRAANEAVDIISIALNLLRSQGYGPDEVAELVTARARDRMQGKTGAILDKYRTRFGI
ncbi:hypothetical protein KIPE111705_11345 [Kibdelosporangium persicum]|uniref:NTP pyrophosphohydrolase MazG putative catalytic core domain-containing protein n=1 Tax=Kibdelosporangium persicum TaxID=2698649 RepID=A0ABX2EWL9_9PSEU|nr:hypothetical protein [Kibdelosporangium persicum]NRN63443.1 hypothetical protein [Kibdelosporangium persicum]